MSREHLRTAQVLGVTNVLDVVTRVFALDGTERGDEYDMLCPDPAHDDGTPSASVNLTHGYWHCFSCGRGGDLIGLGVRALGKTPEQIEQLLRPDTPEALLALLRGRQLQRPGVRRARLTVPLPAEYADGPLTELRERGFRASALRRWDVRYVPSQELEGQKGPFTIYASVGIPIEDENRQVLAWCYRRTASSGDWQPRYMYTGGSKELITDTWFGMQHHARAKDIVIVEGALDAIWCDQFGIPALGLLGASMGKRKLLQLRRYQSVTLLGDLDAGGTQMVSRIGRAIGAVVPLRVATYSKWMRAKDPQELSPIDLELVLARAQTWSNWSVRHGAG